MSLREARSSILRQVVNKATVVSYLSREPTSMLAMIASVEAAEGIITVNMYGTPALDSDIPTHRGSLFYASRQIAWAIARIYGDCEMPTAHVQVAFLWGDAAPASATVQQWCASGYPVSDTIWETASERYRRYHLQDLRKHGVKYSAGRAASLQEKSAAASAKAVNGGRGIARDKAQWRAELASSAARKALLDHMEAFPSEVSHG